MKKKTKDILIKTGVILLCVGALGGIVSLTSSAVHGGGGGASIGGGGSLTASKEVEPTFLLGGINDANGNYESSNLSLFNRFPIETKALKVTLNPNYRLRFQVFFYDKQDVFVSKTDPSTVGAEVVVPKETKARIELIPDSGAMQWDTAPVIANSVKVFASPDAKVDVQGTKGIMTTAYNSTEKGNMLNVLNGTYKGPNYTIKAKNGTLRITGNRVKGPDDEMYEIIDIPLIDRINKSFTFMSKALEGKKDMSFHNFKLAKFDTPDHAYTSMRSPKYRDIASDELTHYALKNPNGVLDVYTIPACLVGNQMPA